MTLNTFCALCTFGTHGTLEAVGLSLPIIDCRKLNLFSSERVRSQKLSDTI